MIVSFTAKSDIAQRFFKDAAVHYADRSLIERSIASLDSMGEGRAESFHYKNKMKGWSSLAKALSFPILFGPDSQERYHELLERMLSKAVQSIDSITEAKVVELVIPSNVRETPQVAMVSEQPGYKWIVQATWTSPMSSSKFALQGKKLGVSFHMDVTIKDFYFSGRLCLHSSPYKPRDRMVQFVTMPDISFTLETRVDVGKIQLPFQESIERTLHTKLRETLCKFCEKRAMGDAWLELTPNRPINDDNAVEVALKRWIKAKSKVTFNGKDCDSAIIEARDAGCLVEKLLQETLASIQKDNNRLAGYGPR